MFRYFVSIVLFLSFFYSISSADLSEGLIGYWKFDEGSGDKVKDISGEDHHGKLVSGEIKWIDGKEKKAIYSTCSIFCIFGATTTRAEI